MDWTTRNGARALIDQEGATTMEYALILAAAAGPLLAGMHAFADTFSNYLSGIVLF